jgi:adenylosuccinate synthase
MPYDMVNENIKPVYKKIKGWKNDLSGIDSEKNFPPPFNDYISFLEKELNVPISIVSVGPDRIQTITRKYAIKSMKDLVK